MSCNVFSETAVKVTESVFIIMIGISTFLKKSECVVKVEVKVNTVK